MSWPFGHSAVPSATMTAPAPTPGGYDVLQRLLTEMRPAGHSRTLERWLTEAHQRLGEFRAQARSPRLRREAESIECAYDIAGRLVALLRLREFAAQR